MSLTSHDPRGVNVGDRLRAVAQRLPDAVAVASPGKGDVAGRNSYATCTFRELDRDADALARGLIDLGVTPGMRLALLVEPGVEFVKLVFALLRSGAATVLIDPGMGPKHVIDCLASMEPQGFVGVSAGQAVRTVFKRRFPDAKYNVTVGRRWFWGGATYRQLLNSGAKSSTELPTTHGDDTAAIIFTSGSTGPPKGVLYTHRMFDTQASEIQQTYDIQPGGADLACFALFGLFNSAMGVTTVFPEMDFSRPASAKPQALLTAASDWQVTQAFASPTVWDKLSQHCERTGAGVPTLRKVFSCGAPVPAEVLQRTLKMVAPDAEMHTPYGATESLPVATIEARKVLGETAEKTAHGAGVCVGRKFTTVDWRVIRISDDLIAKIEDTEELPQGEIGELIVRGPQVSPMYVPLSLGEGEDHNDISKIADGETVWHRIGDVGYFDEQQRFWYCGRKSHRVRTEHGTMYSIPVEAILNDSSPWLERTALVGIEKDSKAIPAIVYTPRRIKSIYSEPGGPATPEQAIATIPDALSKQAKKYDQTRNINIFIRYSGSKSLPVDVRHNAKINREKLAKWVAEHLQAKD